MRPLEKDGTFGAKSRMEYILDNNGEKIKLPSGRYKTKKVTITDWDDRGNAEIWRKGWADTLNKHLKHFNHEEQVDHRSYERQGLEILPTIHLGATAHALEQKGIHTERGDINRAIIAENERIKNINKEIRKAKKEKYEILNPPPPPKPQFLIDVENSIKAKESPGYEHWCRIFNIQQMAKTLIFIQENGYTDIKSLQTAHQNASNDVTNTQNRITEIKGELKTLRKQKEATETYRRTVDTWKEYNSNKWWRQSSKDKFYEENKADIEAYKSARDYIYTELKLEKFPSLKKLSGEISTLTAEQKELEKALPTARQKANSLNVVTHNARMILGYNKLEQQHIDPIASVQDRRYTNNIADVPVCKSSFVAARKAGETPQYFQNLYLNKECAEAIKSAVDMQMAMNKNEMETATRIIETYGIERVKWVLATIIANDTSENFAPHKEWAVKIKLPNEPIDKPVFEIGDGKKKYYPNFIRAVQIKDAEIRYNKGEKLSHEDNMAVAKLKADAHNKRNEERREQTVVAHELTTPTAYRSQAAHSTPSQQKPAQQSPQQQAPQNTTPTIEAPSPPKKKVYNRGR